MDSTALVIDAFKLEELFETCYISFSNNKTQQKSEIRARNKILKMLITEFGHFHVKDHILNPFDVIIPDNFKIIQPKMWLDGILYTLDVNKYQYIKFAYIRNDDFFHFRDDVTDYYNVTARFLHENPPQLWYPFEWQTKEDLYHQYYDELPKVFESIWTCENPIKIGTPCGKCKKCKELDILNYALTL